eukprot:8362083-Pyramimonas_sp.AAC.1
MRMATRMLPSPLLEGIHRPDFTVTRCSTGRVPELDEQVMQDVRDELAPNQDVDFMNKGVRTRGQHAPAASVGHRKAPRAGRSSSGGFNALESLRLSSNRTT